MDVTITKLMHACLLVEANGKRILLDPGIFTHQDERFDLSMVEGVDRVLRMEASFAGTSFLSPEMEGRFRYGSEVVNVVADATCPRGLGSFGYDDEGVLAQRISIIREGIFSGFLSTRETSYRMEGEAMAQCGQSAGTTSPLSV